jgi:RHS repeat-associated protein
LIRVSDSIAGETLYAYDDLNRLVSETTDRGVVSYRYDALGRLTERRINGSDPTAYAYDKANRIKTITYRNQSVTYNYDTAGRLVSRTLANGITQSYAYSDANELLSLTYKKPNNTVIETVSYTYDANGNRITRNRTQLGSVPETPFTATYDVNNRMLTYNGQPLTYDDNGNLISRQTTQGAITYTWDAQNRLTQISGPNGTASFKYDARGRRIERTINGAATAFLYDGQQAIAELQGSSIGATYLTGLQIDEVLARYAGAGNRTLLTDALGSILALTDDTQTAQTIYGYSPYGEQTQVGENNVNSLQYTGRENDNTGLYFYRARYFDPQLKRFVSGDPIGLAGGLNTYAYVGNNPLLYIDSFGLELTLGQQIIVSAATGVGSAVGSAVGSLTPAGPAIGGAIGGAIAGGASTALMSGSTLTDIGNGMITGGLSGLTGAGLGAMAEAIAANSGRAAALSGALSGLLDSIGLGVPPPIDDSNGGSASRGSMNTGGLNGSTPCK